VVIPTAVNGTLSALRAAAKQPSVKRFVLTSSSTAAVLPKPNVKFTVDENTWADSAVELIRNGGYKDAGAIAPFIVYAASKAEAEKAFWKYVKEEKPHFVANTILPNTNMGRPISPEHQGYPTTAGWVEKVFLGKYDEVKQFPPQYYINVEDNAKLHIIAATDPEVVSERIFTFAGPYNFQDVLDVSKKLYPNRKFDDIPDEGRDLSVVLPAKRAEDLLKAHYGHGWTSFEETIKQNTVDLV
jgi:nucleoside-diphosphate-sugar epimerase